MDRKDSHKRFHSINLHPNMHLKKASIQDEGNAATGL